MKLKGSLVPSSSSPPQLYSRSSARLAEIYGHESEGEEGDETPRWVSERVPLKACHAAFSAHLLCGEHPCCSGPPPAFSLILLSHELARLPRVEGKIV